jgi:hypothetical protein
VQNYTHTSCLYITFFFRSLNKSRATWSIVNQGIIKLWKKTKTYSSGKSLNQFFCVILWWRYVSFSAKIVSIFFDSKPLVWRSVTRYRMFQPSRNLVATSGDTGQQCIIKISSCQLSPSNKTGPKGTLELTFFV